MAEFTNEPPSEVNRRAHDRNGITLIPANNTQLIEFACHIDISSRKGGKPNQLYTKENAIALLNITSNFTQEWNREKAIAAVMEVFDWVEAHADTNPARLLDKQLVDELGRKDARSTELKQKVTGYFKERDDLRTEQQTIGLQQAEYRRMSESELFTTTELILNGGLKFGTNFKDNEWLISYQNKKRRIDWGLTYYRNVVGYGFNIFDSSGNQ